MAMCGLLLLIVAQMSWTRDPCLLGLYRRAALIAKRRLRTTGPRAPD